MSGGNLLNNLGSFLTIKEVNKRTKEGIMKIAKPKNWKSNCILFESGVMINRKGRYDIFNSNEITIEEFAEKKGWRLIDIEFYGTDNETYIKTNDNRIFIISSLDFYRPDQWEELDELPEDAELLDERVIFGDLKDVEGFIPIDLLEYLEEKEELSPRI